MVVDGMGWGVGRGVGGAVPGWTAAILAWVESLAVPPWPDLCVAVNGALSSEVKVTSSV